MSNSRSEPLPAVTPRKLQTVVPRRPRPQRLRVEPPTCSTVSASHAADLEWQTLPPTLSAVSVVDARVVRQLRSYPPKEKAHERRTFSRGLPSTGILLFGVSETPLSSSIHIERPSQIVVVLRLRLPQDSRNRTQHYCPSRRILLSLLQANIIASGLASAGTWRRRTTATLVEVVGNRRPRSFY